MQQEASCDATNRISQLQALASRKACLAQRPWLPCQSELVPLRKGLFSQELFAVGSQVYSDSGDMVSLVNPGDMLSSLAGRRFALCLKLGFHRRGLYSLS